MKYFVTGQERAGTCYHEFMKGKWDGVSFWKEDSICLHDDILYESGGFEKAIAAAAPSYNPWGATEISRRQWEEIGKLVAAGDDEKCRELYREADDWAQDVFPAFECFTILGI